MPETSTFNLSESSFGVLPSNLSEASFGDNGAVLKVEDYLGAGLGAYSAVNTYALEKTGIESASVFGVKYGLSAVVTDIPAGVGGVLGLIDTARSYAEGNYHEAINSGLGGLGAIGGAEAGAEIGLLFGPAAPVTVPVGAAIGALGGTYAGAHLGKYLQNTIFVKGNLIPR